MLKQTLSQKPNMRRKHRDARVLSTECTRDRKLLLQLLNQPCMQTSSSRAASEAWFLRGEALHFEGSESLPISDCLFPAFCGRPLLIGRVQGHSSLWKDAGLPLFSHIVN